MGLLNPNHLWWAVSIAILLAIYLRSRSRPTLEVSSLMLFEEAAAPAARVRHLRIDPLFWLEAAALAAITLALAGLYLRSTRSAARGEHRALVFDLAAGMGAREGSDTRLDAAKKEAHALVNAAPERDRFSIIGYALEGQLVHPETANRDEIHHAIDKLQVMAVPGRRAAQSAALMRARAAGRVEFFADRRPAASMIADSGLGAAFHFHQSGAPADNLAIAALEPGIPNSTRGRATLKNFAPHPQACELDLEVDGKPFFHQPVLLAPREQAVVPFGPLTAGGLVHAKILGPDSLAADNDRYAYATIDEPAKVLLLSPDAAVRDDLARVLLAVNSNFIIAAADPAKFSGVDKYRLAVMHDCYAAGINAQSTLLVFPPASSVGRIPDLRIIGAATSAMMTKETGANSNAAPIALGATRILGIPEWMTVRAWGNAAGAHETLSLTALGALPGAHFGVVAYDIRDHLLLDPDRLDALVATVDLIRELTAPTQIRIVSTGAFLALPSPADAAVTAPDGSKLALSRDQWGRLRLHPLQPGHYTVESADAHTDVYANYYDASESDLLMLATPSTPEPKTSATAQSPAIPRQIQPLSAALLALALIVLILESVLLLRTANRWGMRHV
ncbi:MAG TPA: VWA domain-containing protein [Candidatus Binataceae bacterium]|nr:VWA domain-containing protein [Candidatus Binataceae bacterium]